MKLDEQRWLDDDWRDALIVELQMTLYIDRLNLGVRVREFASISKRWHSKIVVRNFVTITG